MFLQQSQKKLGIVFLFISYPYSLFVFSSFLTFPSEFVFLQQTFLKTAKNVSRFYLVQVLTRVFGPVV